MRYIIITIIALLTTSLQVNAQEIDTTKIERKSRFMPTVKRMDRNVNKINFTYKGELMGGVTASFGSLSSKNSQIFSILNNINAEGSVTTVKPFIGYFYTNNRCIGIRFGYTEIKGGIDSALIDLGPSNDMTFDMPYAHVNSNQYSCGIFHRSYAGLDARGRIGLFAELELMTTSGNSTYEFAMGSTKSITRNKSFSVGLNFNPGVSVFILPNVCTSLSFGLGGIDYNMIEQLDEHGNVIGKREDSKLSLKLNLTAINIGVTLHLWDKEK